MNKCVILSIAFLLFIFSCRKESFTTSPDAVIRFSSDSVFFDTVFVSTGSVTQSVKINNVNNQKILISDIKLMGGTSSPFRINIDGAPGPESANIEIFYLIKLDNFLSSKFFIQNFYRKSITYKGSVKNSLQNRL